MQVHVCAALRMPHPLLLLLSSSSFVIVIILVFIIIIILIIIIIIFLFIFTRSFSRSALSVALGMTLVVVFGREGYGHETSCSRSERSHQYPRNPASTILWVFDLVGGLLGFLVKSCQFVCPEFVERSLKDENVHVERWRRFVVFLFSLVVAFVP